MALRPPADVDDDQNSSSDSTSSSNPAADAAGTGGSLTPTTQTTANKSYKEQKAEKDAAKAALTDALKVKLKAQLEQVEVRLEYCLWSFVMSSFLHCRICNMGVVQQHQTGFFMMVASLYCIMSNMGALQQHQAVSVGRPLTVASDSLVQGIRNIYVVHTAVEKQLC